MKKILKFFVYLFVFVFALLFFLPKESLYNLAEKELKKYEVIVSNEKREEKAFSLHITDGDIYVKGIKVAELKSAKISSYLFFNEIKIKNIKLLDSLQNMLPSPISSVDITYSVLNFDKVNIKANGSFGKIEGFVDLIKRKIVLNLKASSKMKRSYSKILDKMKFKNGRYIYEYKF